jgi:hypothetical protein
VMSEELSQRPEQEAERSFDVQLAKEKEEK